MANKVRTKTKDFNEEPNLKRTLPGKVVCECLVCFFVIVCVCVCEGGEKEMVKALDRTNNRASKACQWCICEIHKLT